MLISATTGTWKKSSSGEYIPAIECIKRLATAGFEAVDINFHSSMGNAGSKNEIEIKSPNWEYWADKLQEALIDNRILANQAHAPFYNALDNSVEDKPFKEEMIRRSIIISGKIGVPWVVMHAGTVPDTDSLKASLLKNIEYFKPHLELAQKYKTGIAIENLIDRIVNRNYWSYRQFTGGIDELLELVNLLKKDFPNVGICWDFGHANMMAINQNDALHSIGNLLKCVHIQDNRGAADDHNLPFAGTIDWVSVMKTLKETGYTGDFTYEHGNFTQNIPDAFLDEALHFSVKIARYLVSLFRS